MKIQFGDTKLEPLPNPNRKFKLSATINLESEVGDDHDSIESLGLSNFDISSWTEQELADWLMACASAEYMRGGPLDIISLILYEWSIPADIEIDVTWSE